MEVDPGFRKRVPFLSSVGERKIMNHFVTAGQYLVQTVQAVQTIQSGVIRRFFIHGLERLERLERLSRVFSSRVAPINAIVEVADHLDRDAPAVFQRPAGAFITVAFLQGYL